MNLIDPYGLVVHQGLINQLVKMANRSLMKTIKSLEKQIAKHEKALSEPCQSQAKKHHEHELKVFREQLELASEEARRRGLLTAGSAGFAEDISEEEAEQATSSWFDWIDPFLMPGMAY